MYNNYDEGLAEDFNNMTLELGREIIVLKKDYDLNYEGQETDESTTKAYKEIVFIQELDSKNEMVQAGQLSVSDVKIFFNTDSQIKEEDLVQDGDIIYKVTEFTKVKGSKRILYIKAYGKKVPGR